MFGATYVDAFSTHCASRTYACELLSTDSRFTIPRFMDSHISDCTPHGISPPSDSRFTDSGLRVLRVARLRIAGLRVVGLRVAGFWVAGLQVAGLLHVSHMYHKQVYFANPKTEA